jgi:hypothetical protein
MPLSSNRQKKMAPQVAELKKGFLDGSNSAMAG